MSLADWLRKHTGLLHFPCDDCRGINLLGGLHRCHLCGLEFCARCSIRHLERRYGLPFDLQREIDDRCCGYVEEVAKIAASMRTQRVDALPEAEDYAFARDALREEIRRAHS